MFTSFRILSVVAVLGAMALMPAPCVAVLVVGNLNQPPDTTDLPLQILPVLSQFGYPGLTAAQQFTTGPTSAEVSHVYASLGNLDLGTSGGFNLTAGLYSDNTSMGNSIPDSLLASFTFNLSWIPTSGFATIRFDTSPITLSANTNYWFVLGATNSTPAAIDTSFGSVTWQFTLSTAVYGPGALPYTNQTYNDLWSNDPSSSNYTVAFPGQPFLIQIGVPEPGSWILGSIGLTTVLAMSRRIRLPRQSA
jgi:hypothetical protein